MFNTQNITKNCATNRIKKQFYTLEYVDHLIHKAISFLNCPRHVTGCNWVC